MHPPGPAARGIGAVRRRSLFHGRRLTRTHYVMKRSSSAFRNAALLSSPLIHRLDNEFDLLARQQLELSTVHRRLLVLGSVHSIRILRVLPSCTALLRHVHAVKLAQGRPLDL